MKIDVVTGFLSLVWLYATFIPQISSEIQVTPIPATTSIMFTEAEQIPIDELGEYSSGITFIVNEKRWEFLSDIIGVTLDAETTDTEYLAHQIVSLINADPERYKYTVPSVHTIQVAYTNDNSVSPDPGEPIRADISESFQSVGINTPRITEDGILLEEIPYSDKFYELFGDNLVFPEARDRQFYINWLFYQQVFYGGLLGLTFDRQSDPDLKVLLFENFNLSPTPTIEELYETFRGLGVIIDQNVYPDRQ